MPTYQYACTNEACGLNFERVQTFTDAAITDCPDCTGRVRKVYGSVGVVFKGSGFYRTDSRAASDSKRDADSSSTSSSGETNGSGSADKKVPAAPSQAAASTKSDSGSNGKSSGSQAKAATSAAS